MVYKILQRLIGACNTVFTEDEIIAYCEAGCG